MPVTLDEQNVSYLLTVTIWLSQVATRKCCVFANMAKPIEVPKLQWWEERIDAVISTAKIVLCRKRCIASVLGKINSNYYNQYWNGVLESLCPAL